MKTKIKKPSLDDDDDDEDENPYVNLNVEKLNEILLELKTNILQLAENQQKLSSQLNAINGNTQNQPVLVIGDITLASPISTIKDLSNNAKELLEDKTIQNYLKDFKVKKMGLSPSYID